MARKPINLDKYRFKHMYSDYPESEVMRAAHNLTYPQNAVAFAVYNKDKIIAEMVRIRMQEAQP